MRWITKTEFARERDVVQGRVSQWLTDGRITEGAEGTEHAGLVEADAAHAALDLMLDPSKGMRSSGENITSRSPGEPSHAIDRTEYPDTMPVDDRGAAAGAAAPASQASTEAATTAVKAPAPATAAAPAQAAAGSTQAPAPEAGAYWLDKAREQKIDADMKELRYLQAAGQVMLVEAARKEQAALARSLRNKMQAMVDRVAPILDPGNPERAYRLLMDEWQAVARELRLELQAEAATAAREALAA